MVKKKLTEAEEFEKFINKVHNEVKGSPKCPICKGQGYTTRKVLTGYNSYAEAQYMDTLDPCSECRETVTRIKRKYR